MEQDYFAGDAKLCADQEGFLSCGQDVLPVIEAGPTICLDERPLIVGELV